jgi:hypothetical protein
MRWLSITLVAVTLSCLAASPALAAWEDELTEQVLYDEACKVAFLSQVVERTIDGRRSIMAKVHCEDKRTFDAYRGDDREPFQFKACEKPEAKSC